MVAGRGNVCDTGEAAIPALSEWGLMIFMTIIPGIGVVSFLVSAFIME